MSPLPGTTHLPRGGPLGSVVPALPTLSHHLLRMDLSPPLDSKPPGGGKEGPELSWSSLCPQQPPQHGTGRIKAPFPAAPSAKLLEALAVQTVLHPGSVCVLAGRVTRAEFSNFSHTEPSTRPYIRSAFRECYTKIHLL